MRGFINQGCHDQVLACGDCNTTQSFNPIYYFINALYTYKYKNIERTMSQQNEALTCFHFLFFAPNSKSICNSQFKIIVQQSNTCPIYDIMDQQKSYNQNGENVEVVRTMTKSGERSNKCNQCDHVSSGAASLKLHLRTHS